MKFNEFLEHLLIPSNDNTLTNMAFNRFEEFFIQELMIDDSAILLKVAQRLDLLKLNVIYKSIKFDNYRTLFLYNDSICDNSNLYRILEINGLLYFISFPTVSFDNFIKFKNNSTITFSHYTQVNRYCYTWYNDIILDECPDFFYTEHNLYELLQIKLNTLKISKKHMDNNVIIKILQILESKKVK